MDRVTPPLLTVTQSAARARVHRNTVGNWIREGLPVIQAGNVTLIREDQLLAWKRQKIIERRSTPTRQKPLT